MLIRLARGGVAEERAFSMRRDERLAWIIALGELEGGDWDWSRMNWRPPSTS
jgi:hypothetical protein